MPERFEIHIVYKRHYINTLPFLSFTNQFGRHCMVTCIDWQTQTNSTTRGLTAGSFTMQTSATLLVDASSYIVETVSHMAASFCTQLLNQHMMLSRDWVSVLSSHSNQCFDTIILFFLPQVGG